MTTGAAALTGTEHYIYRRHGKVYVHRVGGGDPIVFLHAVGGHAKGWVEITKHLEQHFACYTLDLPGHDHSDIPPVKYSMEDYADAVAEVMDAIGLEKANVVGGHTGAMVALILAARYPKLVGKLVLDGLPYWNKKQGQIIWERWFSPMYTDTDSYHVPVIPLDDWEEARSKNPGLKREEWETRHSMSQKSRLWWRLSQEANSGCDIASFGPKVKVPTLRLFGEGDTLRRTEDKANQEIAGSVLKVIPDCPGLVAKYKPEILAKETLDFLRT
jgi:pimeloyl-ACP methyl ester carboxylesterase